MSAITGRRRTASVTATLLAVASLSVLPSALQGGGASAAPAVGNGRIAYAAPHGLDDDWDIYTANPDGSDPVNLTHDPAADQILPVWSPDGSEIAYIESDGSRLMVMNADGSDQRQLLPGDMGGMAIPSWSPDGTRIAVTSAATAPPGPGEPGNYAVDVRDGTLTPLPPNIVTPDWSADGTRLAYVAQARDGWWVETANLDGTDRTRVSPEGINASAPQWSPDGSRIAYVGQDPASEAAHVYVAGADGTGTVPIADGWYPQWSPDGGRILFQGTDGTLRTVAPDGSDVVTLPTGLGAYASWGPQADDPYAVIDGPSDGAVFDIGQTVTSRFHCVAGATPLESCAVSGAIKESSDGVSVLDTDALGDFSYEVTATDANGAHVVRTLHFTVKAVPPTVTIDPLPSSASYPLDTVVHTSFTCTAGIGSRLDSCDDSNGVLTVDGGQGVLDTSSVGSHVYRVVATDADGQKTASAVGYRVTTDGPSIVVDGLSDGETIRLGSERKATFQCLPGRGTTIVSCVASSRTSVSDDGQATIPTDRTGSQMLVVTAQDAEGQQTKLILHYTVVADPPTVTIDSPASGGVYRLHQTVSTQFTCSPGQAGIGIRDCVDDYFSMSQQPSSGPLTAYGDLDTSSPGTHTYTVTATQADGQVATATLTYSVLGPATTSVPAARPLCHGLRATIVGTRGNDVLRGTWRRDVIVGRGGNDTVRARGANDTVCGGTGNDVIYGGGGADWLGGGDGRDLLVGGSGADVLRGGSGLDRLRQ